MDSQRTIQASRPKDQRLYIAGEIILHHRSKDGFHAYSLDRFDDYDSDEKAIYENFNAFKEEVAVDSPLARCYLLFRLPFLERTRR
jgi:hypothetical protein